MDYDLAAVFAGHREDVLRGCAQRGVLALSGPDGSSRRKGRGMEPAESTPRRRDDREIVLLGTAHVSRESVEEVRQVIARGEA